MSHALLQAKLTLPILTILAITGTFILSYNNGFLTQLQSYQAAPSPNLPDSPYALKNHWIGIGPIDKLCVQFIAFFWPVLNGENPSLSLQGVHFLGQGYAIWTLVLVEGWREGSRGRWVGLVTITGLLMENLLLALTLPLYFLLHLFTSPTVDPDTSSNTRAYALYIDQTVINAIPYSVAIGAGVPTLGVLLSPLGSTQQQTWLVLRQIHPVFATVTLYTLVFLSNRFLTTKDTTTSSNTTTPPPDHALLHALNRTYTFATFLSTTTHIAALTLMLTSALTPTVLSPGYSAYFSPSAVFVPPPLFFHLTHSPASIASFAAGAHVFLKYDELFACAGLLVWSITVNRVGLYAGTTTTATETTTTGDDGRESSWISTSTLWEFIRGTKKIVFWLIIGGPAAGAVQLVRERDEWVFSGEGAEEEMKRGLVPENDGAGNGDEEGEGEGRGERPYVDE